MTGRSSTSTLTGESQLRVKRKVTTATDVDRSVRLGNESNSGGDDSRSVEDRGRRSPWRRAGLHLVAGTVVAVVVALSPVLPWSTRSNNGAALLEAQTRLSAVERSNVNLAAERAGLLTDPEVRRLAREEFGLAPVGAEVFSLPGLETEGSAADRTKATSAALPVATERSRVDRLIDSLVFWD